MRKCCAAALVAGTLLAALLVANPASARDSDEAKTTTPPEVGQTTTASISSDGSSDITGPYAALITRYADRYGISPELADAVVRIESQFDPQARGRAGEVGLMQVKPATARMLGYRGSLKGLYDPETNIRYGMKYLAMAQDLGDGTTCGTILKYNAGHAATRMNPISKRYCGRVLALID